MSLASLDPSVVDGTFKGGVGNNLRNVFINFVVEGYNENKSTISKLSGYYHEQFYKPNLELSGQLGLNIISLIRILFYLVYSLTFVVGLVGNVVVCYVVFRQTSMHSVTNIFIANLALSDILLCLLSVPFTPLYLLIYEEWVFGSALCHLVPFAQGASVYISVLTLMSIAIERYSVIVHPFRRPMTIRHSVIIIVAIWLVSFLLTLPLGFFIKVIPLAVFPSDSANATLTEVNLYEFYHSNTTRLSSIPYPDVLNLFRPKLYCDELWPHENARVVFGLVTTIIQFIIPLFIIAFCYIKVCSRLWDRIRTRPGNLNLSSQRKWLEKERAKRTNSMLISMVVIFAVSWLPLNIYNLFEDFYFPVSHWKHSRIFFLVIHVLGMSSTCYNPFLYAWLNDNFRKEFKNIFLPLWNRVRCVFMSKGCLTRMGQGGNGSSRKNSEGHVMVILHPNSKNNTNGNTYNLNTNTTNLISNRTPEINSVRNKQNVEDENVSITLMDTTTNMVTNLESISQTELQEKLKATSQRNGLCRGFFSGAKNKNNSEQFQIASSEESTQFTRGSSQQLTDSV